jgi:anion-transporting  ArsA/GET3 family ATPase
VSDRLDTILSSARVIVCVGQGGVGKTSTSAAIALEAAHRGRRALVLTIDPARRLANALGMREFGNEERAVDASLFSAIGLPAPSGKLTAMMLDIKQTWDEVIAKYHPDPERRAKLLKNRLYEALSSALAGSQEYMAMEKLYELSVRKHDPLDLIVLDTPPAANVVDFLEAPSKMLDALDNDATRWLLEPYVARGRISTKLFDAGSSFFIRTISRFTGAELIDDLAEMLSGFQGMFDGFRERAKAVRAILEAKTTSFVVVAAPRGTSLREARAFRDRLVERKITVGAMVLNRATVDPFRGAQPAGFDLLKGAVVAEGGRVETANRLIAVASAAHSMAQAEAAAVSRLRAETGGPVAVVPELPADIHDLVGLDALRRHLF